MAERSIRLTEQHVYSRVPDASLTQNDLKLIYGPRYGKLRSSLLGIFTAQPTADDVRPAFAVRARSQEAGYLNVHMGDVSQPGQAAGWAALQLYQNKRDIFLDRLSAMDSDPGPGGIAYIKAKPAQEPVYVWPAGPYRRESGIWVKNTGLQPLPAMLAALEREYQELMPNRDHGEAIGGIVGARNLDDFYNAWDEAWTCDTPAAAARTLLESEVFISDRAAGD